MISLAKALKENRLEEFIQQQEASGIGSIKESDFERLSAKLIKFEKSEDQT